ncbi:MAG: transglutaminase domain-containing protein [Deltaproteobacteria bacterium]|nr:transglutaminase domain-containing protein [Deltaproteobacteria bacterium]
MKKMILVFALVFLAVLLPESSGAKTLILEGKIDGVVEVSQERVFGAAPEGIKKLVFRFTSPAEFSNAVLTQRLSNHKIDYNPKPDSITAEKDSFGNVYTIVTWTNLRGNAAVKESFDAELLINLKDLKSSAPFPLPVKDIPADAAVYLKPTPLVQSDDPGIKDLAAKLTNGADTEHAAVTAVLNWVIDNIKYKTPIPNYDAVWTLTTGHGNCQNYAHLAIALLRARGIPARIVGGIALGKSWKVPLKDGALLQSIGQGGHAWMEVWYQDIGWVPYDAQQSHLFVGPRHIKQTAGLDSNDINDSWRTAPVLPDFREDISAEYKKEEIALILKETIAGPANYVMTSSITAARLAPAAPPVIMARPPEKPPEVKPGGVVEFGNLDFASLMDFYVKAKGDTGQKTFDKETAEYVTGPAAYAQAFTVDKGLRLETISLAMHKFGGRIGSLWMDVVNDENGKPGMQGIRSMPLNLDTVSYVPGYKWFDFKFFSDPSDQPELKPGKYWIVLRHSKDAVVNWFYTPGNQYGGLDDARSTASGIDWSYIMNADFNFKVRGVYTGI